MLRSLRTFSRNLTIVTKRYPKNAIFATIRPNTTISNAFKSQKRQKKEPGEIIKWILLAMPAGAFSLGCWQVYRLQWKLELIDILQSKSNATPVDMPKDFSKLNTMEYMPVKVRGEFVHDKEVLVGPRALVDNDSASARFGSLVSDPKKNQGWLVVTPFRLSDTGEVILINRGWVPQNMRPKEKRQPSLIAGEVQLVGVVRLSEKRAPFMPKNHPEKGSWLYRDLEQLGAHAGAAPVWLDARGAPDARAGWPRPNQTRVALRNEHLSYAVTWLALAAATGLMWRRYFVQRLALL